MTPEQESLIEQFQPLCVQAARQMSIRSGGHADESMLLSAAQEGLVKAVLRMKPELTYSLQGYLGHRIHCAMIDDMRLWDWNPRYKRTIDSGRREVVALESLVRTRTGEDVLIMDTIRCADFADKCCQRIDLVAALRRLPERSRLVMLARMFGMKQHEIGAALGLTESRINQIEKRSSEDLRPILSAS